MRLPCGTATSEPYWARLTSDSTAAYSRMQGARSRCRAGAGADGCSGIAEDRTCCREPVEWCGAAPVPRSPSGACAPPTIDRRGLGRPVHSPSARSSVRFVIRRDAAHRGLSGRRPRTFERTSIPTAVGRGRSRTRVTNRATMSDRPRAGNASGGTYRPSSSGKDDRLPGQREAIVLLYAEERRATAAVPVWRRLRGSGPCLRCTRSHAWYARRPGAAAIGKAPHPDSAAARKPRFGPAILRASPGLVEAARTGEVMRSRDHGASSVP